MNKNHSRFEVGLNNGSVLTLTCSGIETLEGFFKGIEEAIDHDQIYIQYAQAIIKVDAITYVCGLPSEEEEKTLDDPKH